MCGPARPEGSVAIGGSQANHSIQCRPWCFSCPSGSPPTLRFTRVKLWDIVPRASSLQLTKDPDHVRSFGSYNSFGAGPPRLQVLITERAGRPRAHASHFETLPRDHGSVSLASAEDSLRIEKAFVGLLLFPSGKGLRESALAGRPLFDRQGGAAAVCIR